jgi:hypothetical protein
MDRPKASQKPPSRRTHGLFSSMFTEEELEDIAVAAQNPTIDDVIPLLLVRIRRAVQEGASLDSISRGIDTYIRACKAKYLISGDAAKNLETAFQRALDEIAAELGIPL